MARTRAWTEVAEERFYFDLFSAVLLFATALMGACDVV
jgi:hypothetical protein